MGDHSEELVNQIRQKIREGLIKDALVDSDSITPEIIEDILNQTRQQLFKNVRIGRDLITGDIVQKIVLKIELPPPSPPLTSIPHNLPYSGAVQFVGRVANLKDLHQQLQSSDRIAITALAGMGGVGKTELALQYALRNQENYPGGLCWLQVRGADLGTQIVSFGRSRLGLKIPDELDLNEQIGYCWGHWREGTALILLDDVPSFGKDYYKNKIDPYLPPPQSRFKVLMTSRQRPGASIRHIDLDVLSPDAALNLLRSLIGMDRIEAELEEAKALCKWLGYLPLGLELVGRYLHVHSTLTITKARKRLEKKKLTAKALVSQEEQGDMTAQLGVAAAFDLSWNDLPQKAKQLGCRLSLFAPASFDWSLVASCAIQAKNEEEREEEQEELEEIRDLFLVNRNLLRSTKQESYRMHQLIREFFQTKLSQLTEAESYRRSFCKTMATVASKVPEPPTTHKQILAVSFSVPHIEEAAKVLTDFLGDEDLYFIFAGLGRFYEGQGVYSQSAYWYEYCLSMTRELLGKEHPNIAHSLNNLGFIYYSQGIYKEAEPLYQKALKLREQLLGEEHPDVAQTLNNLGLLYYEQGKYRQAENFYKKALKLREQLLGEEHPDVAQTLSNLGLLYYAQKRYEEAELLYKKALKLREQLLGEEHPRFAISLNNLGLLYYDQKRYKEAEPLYKKALKLRIKLQGKKHPDVATSLNNLGLLYYAQKRYKEAEKLYQKALSLQKFFLGEEHPRFAISLNNLGLLYYAQKRYKKAESLYKKSLIIAEKVLGAKHPHTMIIREHLEDTHKNMLGKL
ncbi:MAG: tetratricopeptide repeat protein [Moorea sp. SIO2B7]|nr:tetratricopeptide repeat protein [Moorena sp. SIO2B7]